MLNNDDLFLDETPVVIKPKVSKLQKAPYADCDNCPLQKGVCVPSAVGSDAIKLIIVGEAPGYNEAKTGVPFVGASGQMLDYLLELVEINREETLITNAVLCRLDENQTPSASALQACQERLQREIDQYPDAQIVTLGRSPYSALKADYGKVDDGILKARGQWHYSTGGREFLATLHPAFVSRSPGYFTQLRNDFLALTVDRSRNWLETEYTIVNKENDRFPMMLAIDSNQHFAFDVETNGLDPHNADLLCLAVAIDDEHAYIFDKDSVIHFRKSLQAYFKANHPIAHNGKFDCHVLARYGLDINLADDTMLAHYALDEMKGTHGLKSLASTYLGVQDYEQELVDKHFKAQDREKRDYSIIPQNELYQYVAIDACVTLALNNKLQPLIDDDNVRQAYNILIDASNAIQLSERKGIKVDRPYLKLVLANLTDAITENVDKVQFAASGYAVDYIEAMPPVESWRNPDPSWIKSTKRKSAYDQYLAVLNQVAYGDEDHKGVNLGSWRQMQVLLYDILKLTHQKKVGFKTKPRSTNAEALDALSPLNHPFVKVLQEFRRLDKIRSTYVEPLLRLADKNDRVHINFLLHGTETGRLSASDSLHGIPRPSDIWGQAIRGSFIADKGKKLIIADYSQAELKIFAALSGETFLLDAFNRGEDIHGLTTKLLFENDPIVKLAQYDGNDWYWLDADLAAIGITQQAAKNRWKELRTIAKNVNFGGLVYLGGASGISAMIRAQTGKDIPDSQVRPVLTQLQLKMPKARLWQKEQFRFAKHNGYVQSRFGNKRRFPIIDGYNNELMNEIEKASVNAPIQNAASQLTLLSAIELSHYQCDVLHLVHDSLIIEVDATMVDTMKPIIENVMVSQGNDHFPEVAWKVDIEDSDRWYQDRPEFKPLA